MRKRKYFVVSEVKSTADFTCLANDHVVHFHAACVGAAENEEGILF